MENEITSRIEKLISSFDVLSEAGLQAFIKILKPVNFSKKEILLAPGTKTEKIYIVLSGAVREFLINEKEEEVNLWFGFENDFVVSLAAFVSNKDSKTGFQALEELEALEICRKDLYSLYDDFHEIERLGRIITEQYFVSTESYHHDFHYLNANDRFNKLTKERPEIFQRVSLSHIASYLGITIETLSRLRAKN